MTGSAQTSLDDQLERISIIQHVAREFFAGEWSNERFRMLIDSSEGYDTDLWRQICKLGWSALMLPENDGGAECTFRELVAIVEEVGRALAPVPLAGHVVAGEIARQAPPSALRDELCSTVTDGVAPLTIAVLEADLTSDRTDVALAALAGSKGWVLQGEKRFVGYARSASFLIVAARLEDGELGLFAVPANSARISCKPLKMLDWSAIDSVTFDDVIVPATNLVARGARARDILREALSQADVLLVAEMCGVADVALDLAVDYAKIRETYGKPIGQYQAVKHRLVNLRADIEIAKALVRAASNSITGNANDRHVAAAQAAYWAIDALKKVPEGCLQVFGGIGFTWEHDIHLYLRRCATLASQLGDRTEYREMIVGALDKARFSSNVA